MRLLLFGIGLFYQQHKRELVKDLSGDTVVGFVDNRARDIRRFEGKPVYLPEELANVAFDRILLASVHHKAMRRQLLSCGIPEEKIVFCMEYVRTRQQGKADLPCPQAPAAGKKRILIVTHDMNYDGGSIVVTHAAHALMELGHIVTLSAPVIDPSLEAEVRAGGINFVPCPALPYIGRKEIAWIEQYDVLLVNVFQNIRVACSMRKRLPVLWWIHEADDAYSPIYPDYRGRFRAYDSASVMDGIRIFGVSRLAAEVFSRHYPGLPVGVLPYGIPDAGMDALCASANMVFAVIGGISPRKGQRELLQAIRSLEMRDAWPEDAEIWLIGRLDDSPYAREVRQLAETLPRVKLLGVLTREEMQKAYRQMDVVVCASQQELLSTVMVEGLMHGKICLTTRNNGIVSYLHDGVDSYVCADHRAETLAAAIYRILQDRARWREIRRRARMVYENHFSMEKFKERLRDILDEEGMGS